MGLVSLPNTRALRLVTSTESAIIIDHVEIMGTGTWGGSTIMHNLCTYLQHV